MTIHEITTEAVRKLDDLQIRKNRLIDLYDDAGRDDILLIQVQAKLTESIAVINAVRVMSQLRKYDIGTNSAIDRLLDEVRQYPVLIGEALDSIESVLA